MAITLIIGYPGSGKSYYQTLLLKKAVWANPLRPIYTNYEIKIKPYSKYYFLYLIRIPAFFYNFVDANSPRFARIFKFNKLVVSGDNVIKFQELKQLYDVQNAIICIDEMATLFSSRDWKDTPAWFLQKLAVHRHEGLDLIGTTQRYDGIDNIIRELSENVFWVQKFLGGKLFKVSRVKYHPVLGTPEIKWYNWLFASKKTFNSYNSWSNEAISTTGGTKHSYLPKDSDLIQNKGILSPMT